MGPLVLDRLSAILILQAYLDHLVLGGAPEGGAKISVLAGGKGGENCP
jgi:hypothetical protein